MVRKPKTVGNAWIVEFSEMRIREGEKERVEREFTVSYISYVYLVVDRYGEILEF